MECNRMAMIAPITVVLIVMGGWAIAAQDKYTVKVPNGLSFADFRGYEDWQAAGTTRRAALRATISRRQRITFFTPYAKG